MEYSIGVTVAVFVAVFASLVGLDRARAFYPTVLVVVASYYVLFAAMGASGTALEIEIPIGVAFTVLAAVGFRRNMWVAVAGIAGHGIFDLSHQVWIANAGVPVWWPGFCASADLILGGWLAIRLIRKMPLQPELS